MQFCHWAWDFGSWLLLEQTLDVTLCQSYGGKIGGAHEYMEKIPKQPRNKKKQRKKETTMGSELVYTSFRFETSSTWLVAVLVATRALRPTTLQRMALASFRVGELCHDWCKGSRRRRLNLAAGETCKSKHISCGIGERIAQADGSFGREQETSGYAGRWRPISWMGGGINLGSWIGPWCIWTKMCRMCCILHVFWICICICVWCFCIYYISKSFIVLMKLRFFRYIS